MRDFIIGITLTALALLAGATLGRIADNQRLDDAPVGLIEPAAEVRPQLLDQGGWRDCHTQLAPEGTVWVHTCTWPVPAPGTTPQEDEPGFDCRIHGNRVCGNVMPDPNSPTVLTP